MSVLLQNSISKKEIYVGYLLDKLFKTLFALLFSSSNLKALYEISRIWAKI